MEQKFVELKTRLAEIHDRNGTTEMLKGTEDTDSVASELSVLQ